MAALIPSQLYGADEEDKPADRGSLITSGALNIGRSVANDIVAPAMEVMKEVSGDNTGAYGATAGVARKAADKLDAAIPEERRKDRDAAFIPEGDQRSVFRNPGSSAFMKATGAAPSIAAYIAAGPAAPVVGAGQAAGIRLSEVRGRIEKATEDELFREYPKYVEYTTLGLPENEARKLLIDDELKGTMLPTMVGGAAGAYAYGRAFGHAAGRGMGKGVAIGAGEGALGGAFEGVGQEVSNQQGDMNVGRRAAYDPIPITRAAANSALEGAALAGGIGAAGSLVGKGRDRASNWAAKQLDAKKARDAAVDVDGLAPDPAQAEALTEGGPTALDAQIDAAAAGAPDALKPPGTTAGPVTPPATDQTAPPSPTPTAAPPSEAVIDAIHAAANKRMKATEIHTALVKALGADAPSPTEVVNILGGLKASGDVTKNAGGYKTTRKPPPPAPKTPVLEKTPVSVVEAVEVAKPSEVVEAPRNVPGEEASKVAETLPDLTADKVDGEVLDPEHNIRFPEDMSAPELDAAIGRLKAAIEKIQQRLVSGTESYGGPLSANSRAAYEQKLVQHREYIASYEKLLDRQSKRAVTDVEAETVTPKGNEAPAINKPYSDERVAGMSRLAAGLARKVNAKYDAIAEAEGRDAAEAWSANFRKRINDPNGKFSRSLKALGEHIDTWDANRAKRAQQLAVATDTLQDLSTKLGKQRAPKSIVTAVPDASALAAPTAEAVTPSAKKVSTIKLKIAESAAKKEAAAGEAKTGVQVVKRKIKLTADDIKIRTAIKAKLPGEGSDDTARKVAAIVKKNMATETEKLADLAKMQAEAEAKAAAEAKASGKPNVFKRTELPPETPEAKLERHVTIALEQHRDNRADDTRTRRNVQKDANETAAEELVRDTWTDERNKPRDKELADEARKALGGDGEARKNILQRVHNMLVLAAQKHIQIARQGFRTDQPEESNSTPWRKYLNDADKFNTRVKKALNEKDPTEKKRQLDEAFADFLPRDHEMRGGKDALTKETVTPKGKAEVDAERAALIAQQEKDAAVERANSKKAAGAKDAAKPEKPKTAEEQARADAQAKLEEAEAAAGVKNKVDIRDDLEKQAAKDDGDGLNPDDYGDGRAKADREGVGLMDDKFQKLSKLLIRAVLTKRVKAEWTHLAEHMDAVWAQLSDYEQTVYKTIYDKLLGPGEDTRVFIVSDAVWDAHGLAEAGGFYESARDPAKAGIIFLPERMAWHPAVVFHEGVHAATERALKYDPSFKEAVERLMHDTLAALPEGGARQTRLNKQYGFHNASEFIAEVHSNPQFRDMLAAVKLGRPIVTPMGTLRTMWDKFVYAVKDLFGIKTRGEYTALDRAMRLADDAMVLDEGTRIEASFRSALKKANDAPPSPVRPSPVREYFEARIPAKIDWKLRSQRVLDKVASVVQMTNNSDHLFGESRPARKLAEFMGKMSTMKDKIISEKAEPLIKNMSAAQRKFDQRADGRSQWTDFAELMHDASRAGVHPDKVVTEQFKKENTRNWYQTEVHKDLSARYEKMPQELKDLFHEATDYFRTTQNQMSLGLIRNALKAASPDGKGSEALAQRIFNKKLTDADKVVLGKDGLLASIQKAGALSRVEGPYVPFMRRGDFVVTARHEVEAPAGARRINDEEAVDPQGNTYEFKTEQAAKDFVQKTLVDRGLRPTEVSKMAVDPATDSHYRTDAEGKKKALILKEEPNADVRWRVSIEPKHVEFHERASDAAESRQGLIDKDLRDVTHVDVKKLDPAKMNDAFMPLQMQRMLNALQKREGFKKLDKNAQDELVRQLREAGIASMGSTRAQSHRLPRNNILGYSEDILKNTGVYASSTAGYLARLRYRPDVDAALKEMTDYTERMTRAGNDEYIPALRRQRLNELTKRAHAMNDLDPDNMFHRVTSRLLQLSYLDKLASPAFHVINSSEPWTITLPVLAARHGVLPTIRALSSAYNLIGGRTIVGAGLRDTYRAGRAGHNADLTDYQTTLTQRVAKDAEHGEGLVKLFTHLHDVGLMARDAGMELSRITDMSSTKAGRVADRADLMARQVGAAIESVNRGVTAVSAYKMERAKGANHAKAMEYAVEQVHDTMKDYASWNAPPMFNHPVGRLALQFKKYAQGTYYLLGKTAIASFKGDKQAMKTFAYLMATHMVTAGALGMPLEAIRLGMMGAGLLGMTDKTYEDFEQGVRSGAANVLGVEGGQVFTRGVARWAGIDLASRVSFNNLLTSGQDPKSMKPDDLWAWIAKNFAGAPASLLIDGVQGFQALGKGDVAEASRLLVPLKVWADSVQAYQWATDGRKSPSGRQQMEPISMGDAFVKASGFTPGSVAERNEKTFAIKGDQRQFKKARDKLTNDWINASPDEKTAMWREITKWNDGQPDNAKIKLSDLMNQKRRRDQEKLSEDRADGMNLSRRDRHIRSANDYYNVPITR